MKHFVLSKKYIFLTIILLSGACVWFFQSTKNTFPEEIEVGRVEKGTVEEVINETGFVNAARTVDLAFQRGGQVSRVNVEVGNVVTEGDALLVLNDAQQKSDLMSAQARLEAEQIRLHEMISGADSASLAVTESGVVSTETALENAKRSLLEVTAQHNQLVANAEKTLRTSSLQAFLVSDEKENSNYVYTAPTITGVYDSTEEGVYRLELYNSDGPSGASVRITGLETDTIPVSTVNPVAIGTRGLRIQFPDNFAKRTTWEIPIPNTHSSSYLVNLNAYTAAMNARDLAIANAENAVKLAEATLAQSHSQLTQVSGSAREERIMAQRALIRQMEALVEQAQVAYNDTNIRAPFSGVVTSVTTEVGQIVAPGVPVVSLIAKDNFELTVEISEVDIAEVSVGDLAAVTFDAYDNVTVTAKVSEIAPNATLIAGVRVFVVTLLFDSENELIKDGLTAQLDITTATREGVIAIPTRSIYENENGKFVRSINEKGDVVDIPVTTGLRGSNGLTEVTSGLAEGTQIITFAPENAIAQIKEN